jgi:hypothetical protein
LRVLNGFLKLISDDIACYEGQSTNIVKTLAIKQHNETCHLNFISKHSDMLEIKSGYLISSIIIFIASVN